jgi:hypothetical protein
LLKTKRDKLFVPPFSLLKREKVWDIILGWRNGTMDRASFGIFCTRQRVRIEHRLARDGYRARLALKRQYDPDLQLLIGLEDCEELDPQTAQFEYRRGVVIAEGNRA